MMQRTSMRSSVLQAADTRTPHMETGKYSCLHGSQDTTQEQRVSSKHQIQSPSCNLRGRYTWLRYWNPKEERAWISAFSFVLIMVSSSVTHSGLALIKSSSSCNPL